MSKWNLSEYISCRPTKIMKIIQEEHGASAVTPREDSHDDAIIPCWYALCALKSDKEKDE